MGFGVSRIQVTDGNWDSMSQRLMGSGRVLLCFCFVVLINFFELLGVVVSLVYCNYYYPRMKENFGFFQVTDL